MNILLVDDNRDFLHTMKQALYARGYTVYIAENGIQGCEILTATNIDLFISDIRMPKFDGIRLHAYARELSRYKNTKFVFISGYRDSYSDVLALNPEHDFFLDKTTPPHEIVAFIDKILFGKFVGVWV
ncbi:MAG: response regulator [Ignavibacteriae bacterium]|nr:response regulator [Ignavibacteriota bacterium]